ncbi:hypothetical protein DRJ17_00360 [Candidatus Woesearchaeota archaeon]|nr:MAG: hypothetical protein DRJ17_00360 [Candidatus Woesearchaeota archaeon]
MPLEKKGEKGQITTYIIIGLIVLILVALTSYILTELRQVEPRPPIPIEFMPIKNTVDGCINDLTREAIKLASLQGGYIELPPHIDRNPLAYYEYGAYKIPYWYYEGEDRSLDRKDVEKQLSKYIKTNLRKCTANLSFFKQEFIIEENVPLQVEVSIQTDRVVVVVNYPIRISDLGRTKTKSLPEYQAVIKVRLGDMIDLANEINDYENQNLFLEKLTMDMIATANTDRLGKFPYQGAEFYCGQRQWLVSDLKEDLKKIIKYNLRFLEFKNTAPSQITSPELQDYLDYYRSPRIFPTDDPDASKINYVIPLTKKHSKLKVEHQFSDATIERNGREVELFPMSFDVAPKTGFLVEPYERNIPLIGQCIKIYHHFYDVSYPLLFKITDVTDTVGDQAIFYFLIPVQIKKNQPYKITNPYKIVLDDSIDQGLTKNDYCNSKDSKFLIFAQDFETGESLAGVNITYRCARFECNIGQTDYQYFEGSQIKLSPEPFLSTRLPNCRNGILTASKQGYLPDQLTEITSDNNIDEEVVSFNLKELKQLEVEINIIDTTDDSMRQLLENETVFIEVENKENNFKKTIFYPSVEAARDYNTFELIFGDYSYNIKAVLIKGDLPIGGLQLDNYRITRDQLSGARKIKFNILATESPDIDTFAQNWNNIIVTRSPQNAPEIK